MASFDLIKHIYRQYEFSRKTFGPGFRTTAITNHIRKELAEIRNDPSDVYEWVDVIILAIDGATRAGHTPEAIAEALATKQEINESRDWPDWRTVDINPTD